MVDTDLQSVFLVEYFLNVILVEKTDKNFFVEGMFALVGILVIKCVGLLGSV